MTAGGTLLVTGLAVALLAATGQLRTGRPVLWASRPEAVLAFEHHYRVLAMIGMMATEAMNPEFSPNPGREHSARRTGRETAKWFVPRGSG